MTTQSLPSQPRPTGRARQFAHGVVRLSRNVRRSVDRFLDDEGVRYSEAWALRFVQSTAIAVGVVVALHFAIVFALGRGAVIRVVVLGGILVGGLLLTGALMALYWRTRLRPDARPYVLAVLMGSLTAAVALEAFCAAQLLLWRSGAVSTVTGANDPSLWNVERVYGWHLLNSIPLLSVPKTLGIDKPVVFTDQISGALLLTFKLVVLVPLVGLAVSAYRFAEQQLSRRREAHERHLRREATKRTRFMDHLSDEIWLVAALMAVAAVAAALLVWLCFDAGSPLRGVLEDVLPKWLAAVVPPIVGVWLLIQAFRFAIDEDFFTAPARLPYSGVSTLGWLLAVFLGIVACTVLVVGATVLLIRAGLSDPAGGVDEAQAVGVALSFHVWHVLDGVPGLEIPQLLNWTLAHDLDDGFSGTLLLGYKVLLVFAVVFVGSRVIQPHLRRSSTAGPGALAAAAEFDGLIEQAAQRVDEYERRRRAGHETDGWIGWDEHQSLLRRLELASNDIHTLFGPGAVAEQADTVTATWSQLRPYSRFWDDPLEDSDASAAAFTAALMSYRRTARRALATAVRPVRRRASAPPARRRP